MKQQRIAAPVCTKFNLDMIQAFRGSEDRIQECITYIQECDNIIDDCEHYLELYDLNATEQIRVTGVLREARRNRRKAIDEKTLIIAALGEIRGTPVLDGALDFNGHFTRINSKRKYRPRAVTLEQCLQLKVKPKKGEKK